MRPRLALNTAAIAERPAPGLGFYTQQDAVGDSLDSDVDAVTGQADVLALVQHQGGIAHLHHVAFLLDIVDQEILLPASWDTFLSRECADMWQVAHVGACV